MGRFATGLPVADPVPHVVGEFTVIDPTNQADNTQFSDTTSVNWSYVIDGNYDTVNNIGPVSSGEVVSRIFDFPGTSFAGHEFGDKIWTPAIEIGFQYTNFADFFYGFSWFDLSHSIGRSGIVQGELGRRAFTDTYSFYSDHDVGWTPFSSNTTTVDGSPDQNYQIYPDSVGPVGPPRREFYEIGTGAQQNVREAITHRIDVQVYESKLGLRSWVPLFGMGRLGVSAGGIVSPIFYRVSGTRIVTWLRQPAFPDQLLEQVAETRPHYWINFGGFVGGELELYYNGFFIKGASEYSFCTEQSVELFHVQTKFNPGGYSALFAAGVRF